jgi:hypothetical protein
MVGLGGQFPNYCLKRRGYCRQYNSYLCPSRTYKHFITNSFDCFSVFVAYGAMKEQTTECYPILDFPKIDFSWSILP